MYDAIKALIQPQGYKLKAMIINFPGGFRATSASSELGAAGESGVTAPAAGAAQEHVGTTLRGGRVLDVVVRALLPLAELRLVELDPLVGDRFRRWEMQLMRARFLSSDGTIHQGACGVSVARIISS